MSRLGYLLRRLLWTVVVVYIVLSATFVLVAAPADPGGAMRAWAVALGGGNASAQAAALESFQAAKGLNQPLLVRYVTFVTNLATFQWGESFHWGRPIASLVAERAAVTLAYVLPAAVVSTVVGTAAGLYAAARESSLLGRAVSALAYAGLGVPNFWLALVIVATVGPALGTESSYVHRRGLFDPANLAALGVPAAALSTTLLAAQLRHVRAETAAYLNEEFIKTARAKGLGEWRVVRHAFRNAALPLFALLFTELVGVLSVSVFVIEVAINVPGLGELTFEAIRRRDAPVVVIAGLLPVFVGVMGNFLQDVLAVILNPRLKEE